MSVGALYQILLFRKASRGTWSAACRQREVCVGCTFHNHHIPSACILLHLSVPAAFHFFPGFKTPALIYSILLTFYINAYLKARLFPHVKMSQKCSEQPFNAEPLVSDSPVLCWAGCWATVSLLALCPMLWHLSPLACWALPLPRPAAGEQNLKPPLSSPSRHGAPVTQDCLDCSLVSFSLSCLCRLALPLPSACVIWSLPPFLPPSFALKHKHTHSLRS